MQIQNTNSHKIEGWMSAIVFGYNQSSGGRRIFIRQISVDENHRLVRSYDLENIPEREKFRELIEEIDCAITEDAEQLGFGAQRYLLLATTIEGRKLDR
jgi:uncharacterized Fe-S center protein